MQQTTQENSRNFAANAGRANAGPVRSAAESLARPGGTAIMTGDFAADFLQMQQTERSWRNRWL
jgi:hypothetical protein